MLTRISTSIPIRLSLLLCILSSLLYLNLQPYGIWLTPDSLSYLEVAENIAAGQGLFLGNYALSATSTPLTMWTPLYPLLLSSFIHDSTALAQQMIYPALSLYALSGLFLFAILKRFSTTNWAFTVGIYGLCDLVAECSRMDDLSLCME